MRYHIYKEHEGYKGVPYSGRSSGGIAMEFDWLGNALAARVALIESNSGVSWIIRDRMFDRDVDVNRD